MMEKKVIEYIENNHLRYLEELKSFLRIPSVSTEKLHHKDIQAAAEFIAEQLKQAEIGKVEIFPTDGHPVVYGEFIAGSDKPTVLIYGHYDVQPADPIELWESHPFNPTIRGGELYARGAADDKGQLFIHVKSAEAYLQTMGKIPVNVKYLIEGEEEIGSAHLEDFIKDNQDLLKADVVMISDTAMFARNVPSLCYGLRGMAYFQIDLQGANTDLHSGSFGGAVVNPAFELSRILAAMKDEKGRIGIPHFYDTVRDISNREVREFKRLPFDEKTYMQELGVTELPGEEGYATLERLWSRPTFEVNGLLSGFTGEGAKTVIPSKAMAKVSMRLVPDQNPEKIGDLFEKHVQSQAPPSVSVTVTCMSVGLPWVASLNSPALVAAAVAIQKGFGKKPVFQREGGSIPIVATFAERFGIPSVLMGIGLPDENAHAPNEKLNLGNFYAGIKSSAYFLDEFSRTSV